MLVLMAALAACGGGGMFGKKRAEKKIVTGDKVEVVPVDKKGNDIKPPPPPGPTTAEMRATASAGQQPGETRLGTTVAGLGDPTVAGFWIRTNLTGQPARGRVVNMVTGASVQVDLLPMGPGPSDAAGQVPPGDAQISLAALRLLGGALTDLPELIVYRS